jgi:hypothetical protein
MDLNHRVTEGLVDKNYAFIFKLNLVKRELVLGAKSQIELNTWINGFNVLFEFREHQNRKLTSLIPGGFREGTDKKIPNMRSQSQGPPVKRTESVVK